MQTDKVTESVPSTVDDVIETVARGGVLSDNDDQVEVTKPKLHRMMIGGNQIAHHGCISSGGEEENVKNR